jgi:hypothetical protein
MKLLYFLLHLTLGQLSISILLFASLSPDEFRTLSSDNLIIRYRVDLERTAGVIHERYGQIVHEIEYTLSLPVDFTPEFTILNDRNEFRRLARSDLTVAFAVPYHNAIVIDHSRLIRDRIPLGETVRHELVHLVLHRHIDSENLPRWLDEGTAQWASGGVGELLQPPDKSLLTRALRSNSLPVLSDLWGTHPYNRDDILLAYQMSKDFVEFLIKRYGIDTFRAFLGLLSSSVPFDNALIQSYGLSLHSLEAEWHKQILGAASPGRYLARNLDTLLFLFMAMLIIVAGIRMLYIRFRRSDEVT